MSILSEFYQNLAGNFEFLKSSNSQTLNKRFIKKIIVQTLYELQVKREHLTCVRFMHCQGLFPVSTEHLKRELGLMIWDFGGHFISTVCRYSYWSASHMFQAVGFCKKYHLAVPLFHNFTIILQL